jgi:hypothetical protein
LASQPFVALASQLPKPALQLCTAQTPEEHDALAFASAQALPHEPQFAVLVCVFVSQPFAATPSQLPNPATHVGTHDPAVQTVVP